MCSSLHKIGDEERNNEEGFFLGGGKICLQKYFTFYLINYIESFKKKSLKQ